MGTPPQQWWSVGFYWVSLLSESFTLLICGSASRVGPDCTDPIITRPSFRLRVFQIVSHRSTQSRLYSHHQILLHRQFHRNIPHVKKLIILSAFPPPTFRHLASSLPSFGVLDLSLFRTSPSSRPMSVHCAFSIKAPNFWIADFASGVFQPKPTHIWITRSRSPSVRSSGQHSRSSSRPVVEPL